MGSIQMSELLSAAHFTECHLPIKLVTTDNAQHFGG